MYTRLILCVEKASACAVSPACMHADGKRYSARFFCLTKPTLNPEILARLPPSPSPRRVSCTVNLSPFILRPRFFARSTWNQCGVKKKAPVVQKETSLPAARNCLDDRLNISNFEVQSYRCIPQEPCD